MRIRSKSRVRIQIGNFCLLPNSIQDFQGFNLDSEEVRALNYLIKSGQVEILGEKDYNYLLAQEQIEEDNAVLRPEDRRRIKTPILEQEQKPYTPTIGRVFIE